MFEKWKLVLGVLSLAVMQIGCECEACRTAGAGKAVSQAHSHDSHSSPVDQTKEAKISAVLDKLSPEDHKIAVSQKYCAVMATERLGAMGAPIKLDIKGTPVFVCCKGCEKKAIKNPDEILERVAAMKANNETTRP
jgi:hypothetical protein